MMVLKGMKIYARREDFGRHIAIAFIQERDGLRVAMASHIAMKDVDENTCFEPVCHLTPESAQMLMDELWTCGLRPTEGSGSAGSLAATERHLKDMQTIAFNLLPAGPITNTREP